MPSSETVAVLIQEASKLLGVFIKSRPIKIPYPESISQEIPASVPASVPPSLASEKASEKATGIKSGCIPCALGHFSTCSGLANEAVRFSRDGKTDEISDRIRICLGELNALERVDLRPEMTVGLNGWEKDVAQRALDGSRNSRHMLEALRTPEDLEKAAASISGLQKEMFKEWFAHKFQELPPEKQAEVKAKLQAAAVKEQPATITAESEQ